MELLSHSIAIIADLISSGLQPIPALKQYGLPYSIFDLVGSLRLALVIRQIREAERAKALSQQRKLTAEGSSNIRELEESYYIKDFATVCTVIYGGEVVCSPWLQFTPSFVTTPAYPLLFIGAQAFIDILPAVPSMSIHTELPFSLFDALTRAFLLTTVNHGLILKHASATISKSPWALCVISLIFANAGFFFVNLFQMLSPYGFHVKTPPELSPGGWRTMDLWVAPLITVAYAVFTQAQPTWVPYHAHLVKRIGQDTVFGSVQPRSFKQDEGIEGVWTEETIQPMGEVEARAICALILVILFGYRAIVNFGIDWAKSTIGTSAKRKRVVVRSKYDGKRLSRDNIKVPQNHKTG